MELNIIKHHLFYLKQFLFRLQLIFIIYIDILNKNNINLLKINKNYDKL